MPAMEWLVLCQTYFFGLEVGGLTKAKKDMFLTFNRREKCHHFPLYIKGKI